MFVKFFRIFGYQVQRVKIPGSIEFPVETSVKDKELISTCLEYSMTSPVRMWSLVGALKYIETQNISGDLIECGVWKGGNLLLFDAYRKESKFRRQIYGFDTFDGMSEPTEHDIDFLGLDAKIAMSNQKKSELVHNILAVCSLETVEKNLKKYGAAEYTTLIKGKVEDSLMVSKNLPNKIAILRLDTDFYESTKIELEILYPLLQTGGILIIDDYGHFKGAKKAVDEYFEGKDIWLHYVDYTCRLVYKR